MIVDEIMILVTIKFSFIIIRYCL